MSVNLFCFFLITTAVAVFGMLAGSSVDVSFSLLFIFWLLSYTVMVSTIMLYKLIAWISNISTTPRLSFLD
ncbi:hypothetical protein DSUL_140038 [Desulfovibrionales bacterium]